MYYFEGLRHIFKAPILRGILWSAICAWAATVILDVSLELPMSWSPIIFSALLLGLYGLLKIGFHSVDVKLHWTAISLALLALWYVLYSLFGVVDLDAILFHLHYDVGSAGVQNKVIGQAITALVPFLLLLVSWMRLCRMSRGMMLVNRCLPAGLLAINPLLWVGAQEALASAVPPPVELSAVYADPDQHIRAPYAKKNLVHIYVESTEYTLWDETRFGNVAEPLKRLSNDALVARNVEQVDLTGWTLAGHVSSTCGVPLFALGVIQRNSFDLVEEVLPEVKCMGDILQDNGYTNVFLKGASLDFAGTRGFASHHGYQRLLGFNELHERFPGRFNSWGLHDEDMLQIAYEQVVELSQRDEPFSLMLTTLGGHAPYGLVSPVCEDIPFAADQVNNTLKGFACTNLLVERFIQRLKAEGLLDNTIVVIQSDHLAMRNEIYGDLQSTERRNLFMILGTGMTGEFQQPASSVDLFPTILVALGFDVSEGRAGLGQALQTNKETLVGRFGVYGLNKAIAQADDLRDRLWGIVRLSQ